MKSEFKRSGDRGLTTEDWIDIARNTLIREGVAAVKIDRLANMAGVTRGGFYHRFKNRDDLLDQLLADWRATNTKPLLDALNGPGSPAERFHGLVRVWLDERAFKPDYDTAIRSWSRFSPKVAAAVHEVDDERIEAIHALFLDAGYDDDEAFIRARITYFHQVGYYAMGMKESAKRREELSEVYYRVLTGFRNREFRLTAEIAPAPAMRRRKS